MHRIATVLVLVALPAAAAAQGAPAGPYPRPVGAHKVTIERDVMVPMRDGVRLATDVYHPTDLTGPLATVLIRTPYNKSPSPAGDASANFFASRFSSIAAGNRNRCWISAPTRAIGRERSSRCSPQPRYS